MITVTVHYYNILRRHTGLTCERLELPDGAHVAAAIRCLADRHGAALAELLLSPSGELASHLVVFVNQSPGGDLRQLVSSEGGGSARSLADGDEIRLFTAVSGG